MTVYRRPKTLGVVVFSKSMFDGSVCVDIFERSDGSFGFEEYRRDVETTEGWFPIGFYSGKRFDSFEAARDAALEQIVWLENEM